MIVRKSEGYWKERERVGIEGTKGGDRLSYNTVHNNYRTVTDSRSLDTLDY